MQTFAPLASRKAKTRGPERAKATRAKPKPKEKRAPPGGALTVPALGFVQTQLTVSEPGDQFEQEADRVAEHVMNMSPPEATPQDSPPTAPAKPAAQPAVSPEPGGVQRAEEERDEEPEEEQPAPEAVQRAVAPGDDQAPRPFAAFFNQMPPAAAAKLQRVIEDEDELQRQAEDEDDQVQRACAECAEEEDVQRATAEEEDEPLQRAMADDEDENLQRAVAEEDEENVQRACAECAEEEDLQRAMAEDEEEDVQRAMAEEEEEPLQRAMADEEDEDLQRAMASEEDEDVQRAMAEEEEGEGEGEGEGGATLQRACAACSASGDQERTDGLQRAVDPAGLFTRRTNVVQRACSTCADEETTDAPDDVQRKPAFPVAHQPSRSRGPSSPRAPKPNFVRALRSARSAGGRPLPAGVRAFMEPRFGRNLAGVRIHTGETAERLNRDVKARAFTIGRDIFFGRGQFKPETAEGKRLIAHELTHVMQQEGELHSVGKELVDGERSLSSKASAHVDAADRAASAFTARIHAAHSVEGPLQRQAAPLPALVEEPEDRPVPTPATPPARVPERARPKPAPVPTSDEVVVPEVSPEAPAPELEGTEVSDAESFDATALLEETPPAEEETIEPLEPDVLEPVSPLESVAPAGEREVGDEEPATPEQIEALISEIDAAETAAQGTLEEETKASRQHISASAASAGASIEGQAAAARATIEASFAAEEAALDQAVLEAQAGVEQEFLDSEAVVNDRVDEALKDIEDRFVEAKERVDERIDQGKNEDTPATVQELKAEASAGLQQQVRDVNRMADAEEALYPRNTTRGLAQRAAVDRVRRQLVADIRAQEPDLFDSIDDAFEDVPDKIEEKREEIQEALDEPRDKFLEAIEAERQPTLDAVFARAEAARQRLENAARDLRTGLAAARDAALRVVEAARVSSAQGVNSGRDASMAALNGVAPQAMSQIGTALSDGRQALSSSESPDPGIAQDAADALIAATEESASGGAELLREGATAAAPQFAKVQGRASTALASAVAGAASALSQFIAARENITGLPESLRTEFETVETGLDETFTDITGKVDEALDESETDLETNIGNALDQASQDARAAVNEGLDESFTEIVGKARSGMRRAAERAGWDYDHPVLAAIRDTAAFIAGVVVGALLVIAVGVLVVAALGAMFAAGGLWAIASAVLVVIGVGALIFVAVTSYRERVAQGEGSVGAFFGALGDALGVTGIVHGLKDVEKNGPSFGAGFSIGEGIGNAVMLVVGGEAVLARAVGRAFASRPLATALGSLLRIGPARRAVTRPFTPRPRLRVIQGGRGAGPGRSPVQRGPAVGGRRPRGSAEPVPEPTPAPSPKPDLRPLPTPQPVPDPLPPIPVPLPTPQPGPQPGPGPGPGPAPVPVPEPEPGPETRCLRGEVFDPTAPTGHPGGGRIALVWLKPVGVYPNPIIVQGQDYFMNGIDSLPTGESIGVDARWLPFVGKPLTLTPTARGPAARRFRTVLARNGYSMSVASQEADHVQDVQWGGADHFQNLWPLDAGYNGSVGPRQNQHQLIYFRPDPARQCAVRLPIQQARNRYNMVGRGFIIADIRSL